MCHIDISIAEKAEAIDLQLLCLPSNTTHELQPLDKAVFRPFEMNWDSQLEIFWNNIGDGDRTMSRVRFGKVFTPTWDATMTVKNIKSGSFHFLFFGEIKFCLAPNSNS